MTLQIVRAEQQVASEQGYIHPDLYRWFSLLTRELNFGIVPPKGILYANLSAQDIADNFDATGLGNRSGKYDGWAICNGSNDTPNIASKFVRSSVTAAGGTGGSDTMAHTHDVDPASFTSGAGSSHTHGAGSLLAHVNLSTGTAMLYTDEDASGSFTADKEVAAAGAASSSSARTSATVISGTSGAESAHTHSIDVPSTTSGAASNTENRPAYYELVPLMRTTGA